MTSIGDSDAVRSEGRVLSQHLAALTMLQDRLSTPGVERLVWLDLACGQGQILVGLDDSLSSGARRKVEYWGYDVEQHFLRETSRSAGQLAFAVAETRVGDLQDFDQVLPSDLAFDYITLTNAVHEIAPADLPGLLLDSIRRLSDDGVIFIYDMERIRPPELGAVPWSASDIQEVVGSLLKGLGVSDYNPEVSRWQHATISGWSVQIRRTHLDVSTADFDRRREDAARNCREAIRALLDRRLDECRNSLEAFTRYGTQTAEEQEDREHLLYDFWAISQAWKVTK